MLFFNHWPSSYRWCIWARDLCQAIKRHFVSFIHAYFHIVRNDATVHGKTIKNFGERKKKWAKNENIYWIPTGHRLHAKSISFSLNIYRHIHQASRHKLKFFWWWWWRCEMWENWCKIPKIILEQCEASIRVWDIFFYLFTSRLMALLFRSGKTYFAQTDVWEHTSQWWW